MSRFLAVATLFFIACSSPGGSKDLLKYQTALYAVQYPANWRLDTITKQKAIEFAIYSPRESFGDKFSENVNLITQDLSGQNTDLDKYAQMSGGEIKANATDLKNFVMAKIQANSKTYYKMSYETTYGDFKVFTEQYYFIKNERAFIITLSSESSKSKTTGEKILESFTLLK